MDTEILISFIIATASLAISPGPDNIFVLIQSITYGKKQGMAIVCGLISGCIIHTTFVAFGLSTFIKSNTELLFVLKLLGAGYMLYLAYIVFKSTDVIKTNATSTKNKSLVDLFKQGFIMNVINPKVSIFFMAFFPAFLFSETHSLVVQFYTLGFLFMTTSFLIFSMFVFFSSSLGSVLKSDNRFGVVLKWVQITVFLGIAIFILITN
ncbi:LysE family translocator [Flavobacteriaceae bacterium]|nr:LysE family translocator [Flavobacteriaceae bacterium]